MIPAAQAITEGASRLTGIADNPRLEARLLLTQATGLTRNDLIRDPNHPVDPTEYRTLLARRGTHEPLALILGHREFWSLNIQVSPVTLIPRPDSETLIEAALKEFTTPPASILDLGTGTGCLLLALLHEYPAAYGIGVDINPAAAILAKANATTLGLTDRASFITADWTNAIDAKFDLIVSNPPYIPTAEIETLMPEVSRHEPKRALDGGADGYQAYRAILPNLKRHLKPNGIAILELGIGQATQVTDLAQNAGLTSSRRHDLAQIPRAIILHARDS
jgi:release factor glutamine methyltransferase